MRSALLTALTFSLAGPAIGTLVYATWAFLQSETSTSIGIAALAALWMLPFGYLLGLVPAAVSGLIAGFVGRDLRPAYFVAFAAAIGAAVLGLVGVFDGSAPQITEGVVNLALIGGLAGGLTGALSRALVLRKRAES